MKKYLLPIMIALLVIISGLALYLYQKAYPTNENSSAKIEKETDDLVASVGQLILLPQGEKPTIATVSDPEKLKDQPFFANAKNGDKVLLYQNAKKVYLYDPIAHKIVEVAPINVGTNTTNTSVQSQTAASTTSPIPAPSSKTTTKTIKK